MSRRRIIGIAAAVFAAVLIVPGGASAHAYLVKSVPTASRVLNGPPGRVALTYDEAVEPRFAIISVTDVNGRQETTGPVRRSPANPDTLIVPVRHGLAQGWYLIYWRAISVDGHPVQGAFTFAVGPDPGPAPKFAVPSISQSATSANLLIAKWVMFLSVMVAIGLFALRFFIARPLSLRVPTASLRPLSIAFVIASVIGVLAVPVYLDLSTAGDSLRSAFDVGALVPLFRVTAFGRGYVDEMLCFALFCIAGWIALFVDRPERDARSVAEIIAQTGAAIAAVAALALPGAVGHAGTTSPRGVSVTVDWLHMISGSVWIGGLVGLLVLWANTGVERRVPVLSLVVPRFSAVALGSVGVLLATGTIATIDHMPALDALWDTGYGVAILVKIAILLVAMGVAAGNLLNARPKLVAAAGDVTLAGSAPRLLRRLVAGETVLVTGAIFVAALLSSLAPPPPSFALQNQAAATVGPGRVVRTVLHDGYRLQVLVSPNKAAAPNAFALRITRSGRPVRHASVTLTFNQTEMQMPTQEYQLTETRPGVYSRRAPALVMVGKWSLAFAIRPRGAAPFTALVLDEANG
jgi:copper transport protein